MSTHPFNRALAAVVVASLLSLTCAGKAANYFVDYAGGSDSNDGSSTGTAWKHCPGDPTATGTPAGKTLAGGDTVFFKGGVNYVLGAVNPKPAQIGTMIQTSIAGISVNWSGTSSAPVTYDGNSAGTWGTGKAVLTDNYSTNNICAFYTSGTIANVVFSSFSFGPIGGGINLPSDPLGVLFAPNGLPAKPGGGISCGGAMNNVLINNCDFANMGYYGSSFPLGSASLAGGAVSSHGCDGLTITNCTLTKMRDALYFNNPDHVANLIIANCTFSLVEEWVITMNTGVNAYLSNVFIFDCLFTNVDQSYVTWNAYGGAPHRDTIFCFGAEGCQGNCSLDRNVTDTNVNIFNNTFVDTLGYPGGSAVIWFQDNASVNIYNNVFAATQQANGAVGLTGPSTNSNWRAGVYNNTFYLSDSQVCMTIGANPANNFQWPIPTANHSTMVNVQNNIIYEYSGAIPYGNAFDYTIGTSTPSLTNNVKLDYNMYRTGQFYLGSMVYGYWQMIMGYMMPGSSRTAGWDTHSITGNPLFINPSAGDFHLATNSPAIGAGVNLVSLNLPGLSTDKDGNQRPATGSWTLGAYHVPGTGGAQVGVGGGITNNPGTNVVTKPPTPTGFHLLPN
jgi:hypothetical protein